MYSIPVQTIRCATITVRYLVPHSHCSLWLVIYNYYSVAPRMFWYSYSPSDHAMINKTINIKSTQKNPDVPVHSCSTLLNFVSNMRLSQHSSLSSTLCHEVIFTFSANSPSDEPVPKHHESVKLQHFARQINRSQQMSGFFGHLMVLH